MPKDTNEKQSQLSELASATAAAISAMLGQAGPNAQSTKKILKWDTQDGLTINMGREGTKRITVWAASDSFPIEGKLDLETGAIIQADAPKNSNLSSEIKAGPTVFLHVHGVERLSEFTILLQERGGLKTMETLNLSAVEIDEVDNVEDYEEDEAIELPEQSRTVLTQTKDESVDSLVRRMQKGRIIVQPDFQRDYVWNPAKASALIESILLNIPLPVIYVAQMENGDWEVVDGQQRLTSIRSFIEGTFPNGSTFRLGKLRVRSDLKGKGFKDLSEQEQRVLEDYTLRVVMIQKEASHDLKFEVFERLNSGADKLNDMELRNCIYRGPYNDLLKDLAKNPFLLKIRGEETPDTRMQDRQLILRFFAMWRNTHLRYRAPMKQFMNHEMQNYRNAPPHEIERMRRVFEDAIQCAWDVFGPRAFRRYNLGNETKHDGAWEAHGKLNIALWDTILYIFTYYERRQIFPIADAIREEFLHLMSTNDTFVDYIGRTTDKPDRVRYRADEWRRRIEALVKIPENETRNFSHALKVHMFERDDTCAICSQKIHSVEDAEIDHIEHYWRGGATNLENGRLTHRYCNRKRGGRDD